MNHRFKDLAGSKFGSLTVLRLNPARHAGSTRWDCRCECGTELTVRVGDLKVQKSCGCRRRGPTALDLTGKRFGRLTAVERVTGRGASGYWYSAWSCRCDCGSVITVLTANLQRGRQVSCGCYNTEKRIRHGLTGTPEIGRLYAAQRRARLVGAGGSHTAEEVRRLWREQGGRCAYCGADLRVVEAELDHVVALSRGGDNSIGNLQWLCKACNRSKHARPHDEFVRRRA